MIGLDCYLAEELSLATSIIGQWGLRFFVALYSAAHFIAQCFLAGIYSSLKGSQSWYRDSGKLKSLWPFSTTEQAVLTIC